MIYELQQTTASAINKKLSEVLEQSGNTTSSRVLTLVILADDGHSKQAITAAQQASHEHPSRIIVHIAHEEDAEDRLDAKISVGGEAGAAEVIILDGWGKAAHATESLISALLLPDSPIVAWWPHSVPENASEHSIGKIAQRRITDSARAQDPMMVLAQLAKNYAEGDTDLAWIRLTLWRIQLAAIFDQLPNANVSRVTVWGSSKSPSVVLLGAWLGYKLDAEVHLVTKGADRGLYKVVLEHEDGEVAIYRPGTKLATLSSPGARDQQIALHVRTLAECLAEELRRLDPDQVYGEVLTRALQEVNMVVDLNVAEIIEDTAEYTEEYDA
ncbi:glucose-6-phosphate dehydrogenase assembly protein OpcA [Rothia sp. ZJ932]|uniref:glucose-6-phosphate dehydrogenase assembly protein OpcA n=1 Tax=Rothia sp. ZJ932 TaxID=2810516 RepID=UPI0019686D02|nr:glucose-6-phosphate dehydrogenase assembly protein OpcA [Rothia sp. ZJ932]QRZ60800.1 glucose-6-phosphate dehydrogenase assembly protein OpcA [Rothia sp. ZJ932]